VHSPLRLTVDTAALVANWRWFAARAGVEAGAAVKADGYGLGARTVVEALGGAGCRSFFVATWAEAAALGPLADGLALRVLHGVGPDDMAAALASAAVPVLNSAAQVARWRDGAPGRPCDIMVDTGMNRLGLAADEISLADGLAVDTVHSHLACADEPGHPLNARQRDALAAIPAARRSLANSAGICLGRDYSFDLVRPGLGLYGGIPHPAAAGALARVVRPFAQVVQLRDVAAGDSVGYGATFTAPAPTRVAILNIGYADGYLRAFSGGVGHVLIDGALRPVIGRVSMDLTAVDAGGTGVREGDWVEIDYDLATAAAVTGLSQYELLTSLGPRYRRDCR
jgi:alanine racemase